MNETTFNTVTNAATTAAWEGRTGTHEAYLAAARKIIAAA